MLRDEYGVDVDKITWVVDDDDHIEGRVPANVERVTDGRSLGELLRSGEIDAALTGNAGTGERARPGPAGRRPPNRRPVPMTPRTPLPRGRDTRRRPLPAQGRLPAALTGLGAFRAVERDPDLAAKLYAAFAESKRRHLADQPDWSAVPRLARQGQRIGSDPVPYGVKANMPSLNAMVRFAKDQRLLDADFPADTRSLFAAGDYPDA